MALPTRSNAQDWGDQALATLQPIFITFRFATTESEEAAKQQARKVQQVFCAMRASTRVATRKFQKNNMFPGPYDDVICEVTRRADRFVVRIEYMTAFDLKSAFEISVGEENA